jgi:adenine-specific DNA-methyltransferase
VDTLGSGPDVPAAAADSGATTVLAHSLSCWFWLHHALAAEASVDRALLVAPPARDICETIPELCVLPHPTLDPDAVARAAGETLLIFGDDDPYWGSATPAPWPKPSASRATVSRAAVLSTSPPDAMPGRNCSPGGWRDGAPSWPARTLVRALTATAERRRPREAVLGAVSDVLATVPHWWRRRAADCGLDGDWLDIRAAISTPLPASSGSAREELLDASPTELGEAYAAALDSTIRLREGRHYTPATLAAALWDEVERAGGSAGPVFDPACGAGSLLLPPLRRLIAVAPDPAATLATLGRHISGNDLDPAAVWLGNAVLAAELLPLWARVPASDRHSLPELLRVGDGLDIRGEQKSTVVMNPPYGRVRLEDAERRRWSESLFGHANRYALFIHAAVERAGPGGIVAALVPTSFLGGAYYRRLRTLLSERAPLTRLTFIDGRSGVFAGDVLQETCIAIFRKGAQRRDIACSRATVNGALHVSRLAPAPAPAVTDRPWLLPRRAGDEALIAAAGRLNHRLSDYGWKAGTGPLVWNRHKAQISDRKSASRTAILWGADIDDGVVRRSAERDAQRWIALRERDSFMRLHEPAVLVQRTTAPEQPRRLVAARLDAKTIANWGGAVVVENHVNVLRRVEPFSPLTDDLLVRLLHTPTLDRVYRCLTGTVAVSAYELEAIPLPPPTVLEEWQRLDVPALTVAVASFYGDVAA